MGLYIGNGNVIEAKGTPYGVVQSKLTEWDEWGELKGISYESNDYPTLSKGARGDSSEKLQNALNDKGFDCGDVDGIFGAKTLSAVKQFQEAKGLIVDGICGQNTWRALLEEDTETLTLEARVIALENKVQALEKYIKGEQQNGTTMG